MAFDFKKGYKEFYLPKGDPEIVAVPAANYIAVRGAGDPNEEGIDGVDYTNKSLFHWNSVIRLPDFVTKADFDWAVCEATKKKKLDCSAAEFLTIDKGFAFRSCISAHLTTNRKRWQRWTHSSRETAMRTTLPTPACTTKSISRTPARSPRKSGKP